MPFDYKPSPLLDQDFIKELHKHRNRETYVKIISYSLGKEPVEELSGRATGGSINLDGNSAVRRSCTLTLVADLNDTTFHEYNWSLSSQFELFVGLANTINSNYAPIIWFPMGFYLISSFSCTKDTSKYTINLQGKDKMCKLNGELGGMFTALTTDISQIDIVQPDGSITTEKLKIKDIIFNLVNQYGQEDYHNIIIKDLDIDGSSLLEYRGSTPMYIFKDPLNNCLDYKTDDTIQVMIKETEEVVPLKSRKLVVERPSQKSEFRQIPTKVYPLVNGNAIRDTEYTLIKLEYGEAAGYSPTDLIYPGKLIANLGESVTSVLDKIKQMLVNYEYFYNEYGQFVFQQKKTTITASLATFQTDSNGVTYNAPTAEDYRQQWNFDDNDLVTNISVTTPINNIKNDYAIWGQNGNKKIHLRYSINTKPFYYKTYDGRIYSSLLNAERKYDWREIIYQMALDKMDNGQKPDFRHVLITNHSDLDLYQNGYTGYEVYYADLEAFWRQLYDPEPIPYYEQVAFDEQDEYYDNRYIDEFKRYSSYSDIERYALDRENIYVLLTPKEGDSSIGEREQVSFKQLQRWIDTVDILHTTHKVGYTYSIETENGNQLYFYEQLKDVPPAYKDQVVEQQYLSYTMSNVTEEASYITADQRAILNNLFLQEFGDYTLLIDHINYNKMPLYIKQSNEDGASDVVFIVEGLSEELQDHVYLSEKENGAMVKYLDGYSVLSYKNVASNLELFSNNFWLSGSNYDTAKKILEIYYSFSDTEAALLWQYIKNVEITYATINLMAEAMSRHRNNLLVRLEGMAELVRISENDVLGVRACRTDKNFFVWYKENEDSTPTPLYDRILTYDATDITNDIYSKYDILIENQGEYDYVIDALDINKSLLYYRMMTDDKTSSFVRFIDMLYPNENDLQNPIFVKTSNKISYTEIDAELQSLYSEKNIANTLFAEMTYHKFMIKEKLNLRGKLPIRGPITQIETLIKYYYQYYLYFLPREQDYSGCWNVNLWNNFATAPFWLEFLEGGSEIGRNSVSRIGLRQKTQNNTKVTGIDFGSVPNIQFVPEMPADDERQSGYTYILITEGINTLFTISSQGKSCLDTVNEWLSQYAILQQTVSLTTVPIYSLSPNTLLIINNPSQQINGDYEITKLTIPLAYNGTMSISTKQIVDSI